jgi:hypothetical protein
VVVAGTARSPVVMGGPSAAAAGGSGEPLAEAGRSGAHRCRPRTPPVKRGEVEPLLAVGIRATPPSMMRGPMGTTRWSRCSPVGSEGGE